MGRVSREAWRLSNKGEQNSVSNVDCYPKAYKVEREN